MCAIRMMDCVRRSCQTTRRSRTVILLHFESEMAKIADEIISEFAKVQVSDLIGNCSDSEDGDRHPELAEAGSPVYRGMAAPEGSSMGELHALGEGAAESLSASQGASQGESQGNSQESFDGSEDGGPRAKILRIKAAVVRFADAMKADTDPA